MVLLNIACRRFTQTEITQVPLSVNLYAEMDDTNQFVVDLGRSYEQQQVTLRKSVVIRHSGTWTKQSHVYVTMPDALLHSDTTISNSYTKTPRLALPCTGVATASNYDLSFYGTKIPQQFSIYFWEDAECTIPMSLKSGTGSNPNKLKEVSLWFELSHTEQHS